MPAMYEEGVTQKYQKRSWAVVKNIKASVQMLHYENLTWDRQRVQKHGLISIVVHDIQKSALGLSARGYRIILVQWPPYWSISAWCDGFKEFLSRLELEKNCFLNCLPTHVSPQKVNDIPITIIDAWDESALCHRIKEDLYKYYPEARLAHLKTGGNFPFLSRSDEVNLHIILHLRNYDNPA
ncbi:SPG21 [Lepeophtheirus salmonis]|uniref:SPG21 n=1 Tax=Lepeophtheirus salmonis TaxID=72036 RepID=A0A7R8CSN3_LEPSM|nr:SPG21 [Lepeophtheirus salmonis]CAF2918548.1 SPG21 [Lepeophtheirus salmonis]